MIWNLEVNGGDLTYFLDFVEEGKRKFSYGSSIGTQWDLNSIQKVCSFLRKYDLISVREADTCKTIQAQLSLPCETVCDPTMLLSAEEWEAQTFPVKEKNYVLVYFPYAGILNAAKSYVKQHHKKLIIVGMTLPWKAQNYKEMYSPQQWLSYIKNADAVFTDSYHGLLFSLYFRRPVWTNNHGNRITELLKELGMMDHFIENDPGFTKQLSYDTYCAKIDEMRTKAEQYLRRAIKES